MSQAGDGGSENRIEEPEPTPELCLTEEQREKLERVARKDLPSSEIAEAVLRQDELS
ncbi:hypothetical protein EGH25_10440 [Haladaptatus sp. F3-133]|jgi:hypothetical protein|uniref:Uncharacterized protein n=1 Tax=Halorutilus salinus TaxID=2487751 RepID=A0A9Q4C7M6_9EURY|nr:hypothetical protein [Halorutilus salinus]MCX2819766.1 hypothetical protein [Halorutilus salinus]